MLELSAHLQKLLPKENTFDWLLNCAGKVHREVKHRRTVEFEAGGNRYFIKIHRGCGWREIFKDLFQARLPIVSARNEWEAIERVQPLGIRTLKIAGKGLRGGNPARRESFLITDALDGMISLEDLTRDWGGLSGPRQKLLKRALLGQVGRIARKLHTNGLNHRDFYLCHFLIKNRRWTDWQPPDVLDLYLIDLHRVQVRERVPARWLVKDLGGLLLSALQCDLTSRDLLRFISVYRERSWREVLRHEKHFWQRVARNTHNLNDGVYYKPVKLPKILAELA